MNLKQFKDTLICEDNYHIEKVRLFFKDILGLNLKRDEIWFKTINNNTYSGFYVSRPNPSIFIAYAHRKDMINIFVDDTEISKNQRYFTNDRAWNFMHVNFLIAQHLKGQEIHGQE